MPALVSRLPHPAVGVLAVRRITRREIATQLGITPEWVSRQLLNHDTPSQPFRRGLSEFLGIPEDELFHDQVVRR